jgi:hypothetical protein
MVSKRHHKTVCTRPQLTRQLKTLVFKEDEVSSRSDLRSINVRNGLSSLGQTSEFSAIDTVRIMQHSAPVDDSNRLVVAEQDLVGTEVSVGATDLDLGNVLLGQSVSSVESEKVLSNRQRGHTIDVVRDTTQGRGALSGSERLRPKLLIRRMSCNGTTQRRTFHQGAFLFRAWKQAQSIRPAVFSSGPKNKTSGSFRPERSTIFSLIPGDCPGMRRSMMASTKFSKHKLKLASRLGRIAALAPPSTIKQFL